MPKFARSAPAERLRPARPSRVEHAAAGRARSSTAAEAIGGDEHPVTVHVHAGRVVVAGRLDMETTPVLDEVLDEVLEGVDHDSEPLELDLRDVTFLDSVGLRTLIRAATRTWDSTVALRVSSEVLRVLELTGTTVLFEVRPG